MGQLTERKIQQADAVFTQRMNELMEHAAKLGNPDEQPTFYEPNPHIDRSQQVLHDKYNRDALSDAYVQVYQPSNDKVGTAKEVIAIKLQHDWLASLERAMHLRSRSRIRLMAHACTRSRTIGHPAGPVGNGINRSVGLLLGISV